MLARPILAADTTVTINKKILGKPANKPEAVEILRLLSDRTHQVLTSVAIIYHEQSWQLTQISDVLFQKLSNAMIDAYCDTTEPYDKAGGYGIQGPAAIFIESIRGSHSGIMGLSIF